VRGPCLVVHSADDDIASLANVELIRRHVAGGVTHPAARAPHELHLTP